MCRDYEIVEYVEAGPKDTTAIVSRVNIPEDLGLIRIEETWEDSDGVYKMYYYKCLRIIYSELNDGRTGTTISKL